MVRILVDELFVGEKHYIEAAGLSTDTKPTTDVITGSVFVEVDSGDSYLYDEAGAQWHKVGASS